MPFGLDFKSIILGALLAYFAIPFIMGLIGGSPRNRATVNG